MGKPPVHAELSRTENSSPYIHCMSWKQVCVNACHLTLCTWAIFHLNSLRSDHFFFFLSSWTTSTAEPILRLKCPWLIVCYPLGWHGTPCLPPRPGLLSASVSVVTSSYSGPSELSTCTFPFSVLWTHLPPLLSSEHLKASFYITLSAYSQTQKHSIFAQRKQVVSLEPKGEQWCDMSCFM